MIAIEVTANFKTDRVVYQSGRPSDALELKRIHQFEDHQEAAACAYTLLTTEPEVVSVILTKVELPDPKDIFNASS